MIVYQRRAPDGKLLTPYFYADLTDPETGNRRRVSTGQKEKRAATREAARLQQELDATAEAKKRDGNRLTLGEALEQYAAHLFALKKPSAGTRENVAKKIVGTKQPGRFHLKADTPIDELTPADIAKLVAARLREGNAAGTATVEVNLIQAACRYARRLGARAPVMDDWQRPKGAQKTRFLTIAEFKKLYEWMSPDRPLRTRAGRTIAVRGGDTRRYRQDNQDLLLALVMTGGRWMEVAGLRWSQVDTETWKTCTIYGSKTERDRLVPVSDTVRSMLQRRYAERDPTTPLVFPREDGLQRRGSSEAILRAIKECGLNSDPEIVRRHGRVNVHTLRHTFASWLLQSERAGLAEVQEILGHTSMNMTRRYAHLSKAKTAARAGEILSDISIS